MRYVWDNARHKWVEALQRPSRKAVFPMIARDLEPYRSIVTGETVHGRSQHREHLARHDLQERGSEPPAFIAERRYARRHGATTKQLEAAERKPQADMAAFSYEDAE